MTTEMKDVSIPLLFFRNLSSSILAFRSRLDSPLFSSHLISSPLLSSPLPCTALHSFPFLHLFLLTLHNSKIMYRKSNLKKERREVGKEGRKVKAGLMNGRRTYIREVVH
jgi:hypothetical protein